MPEGTGVYFSHCSYAEIGKRPVTCQQAKRNVHMLAVALPAQICIAYESNKACLNSVWRHREVLIMRTFACWFCLRCVVCHSTPHFLRSKSASWLKLKGQSTQKLKFYHNLLTFMSLLIRISIGFILTIFYTATVPMYQIINKLADITMVNKIIVFFVTLSH